MGYFSKCQKAADARTKNGKYIKNRNITSENRNAMIIELTGGTLNMAEKKIIDAILLSFCTEYECIKAHYKIRLDSKIFIKYNHELSEKWNTISTHITTD